MASKIVHFEIMGPDGDGLAGFYRDVFGWSPAGVEGFNSYYGVEGDEVGGVGGAVGQGADEMPSYLALYLEVENVEEHLAKVEAAGGTTVVPKQVIPGIVTFAMFQDPAGNLMGLAESEIPAAD